MHQIQNCGIPLPYTCLELVLRNVLDASYKNSDAGRFFAIESIEGSLEHLEEADLNSPQSACTEEITLKEKAHKCVATQSDFSVYASDQHSDDLEQESYLPGLDDETAFRCFSLVPVSTLGKFVMLGRKYGDLVRSGLIFNLRRYYGTVEHLVFIYTSGAEVWRVYDANRNLWRTLPPANVDPAFFTSDKESLSAGTHVLWLGKGMFNFVSHRYDLITDSWQLSPVMANLRCLFASASSGEFAYVAGGFGQANNDEVLIVLNSVERYNLTTGQWEMLPPMDTPRQKCSGFIMDGKFYVIGGKDGNHQPITSGEEYDPSTRSWRTIPNMYFILEIARQHGFEPSPPLVALVNNQLFAVENLTNTLKMYNKQSNTWRNPWG
ncbi:hypothetical protein KP509_06G036600 [Ceratopteris richardii]|uniref:Uncharacterized protein n=1 Tax=Ceratopteris richardii TaxID=49495 RepID=A0A8T2UFI5_CERRI|nr:hypothetical protein KP509_06G036600 [Ceratopteris richardii]